MLANIFIGVFSVGLKASQSIVTSVLQAVVGSGSTQCTNYEMTSTHHSCITIKSAEYYSPIGGGNYDYLAYACAYREDVYAKMQVDAWYNNQFTSNTKTVLIKYSYDPVYYDDQFLRYVTQNQYMKYMAENYNIYFGVCPVWAILYSSYSMQWVSSSSNPFQ